MPDDDLNRLVSDKRIIRNVQKIKAVRENALYFMDLAQEHGSEAGCFANWPSDDFIGLLADMKKSGSPLGGMKSQCYLSMPGHDAFILLGVITKALIRLGVTDKQSRPVRKTISS